MRKELTPHTPEISMTLRAVEVLRHLQVWCLIHTNCYSPGLSHMPDRSYLRSIEVFPHFINFFPQMSF